MKVKKDYFKDVERNCDLIHLPASCSSLSITLVGILLHLLESFSLILCNSIIKSGSFLYIFLYLDSFIAGIQPVYYRSINIYPHKLNLAQNLCKVKAKTGPKTRTIPVMLNTQYAQRQIPTKSGILVYHMLYFIPYSIKHNTTKYLTNHWVPGALVTGTLGFWRLVHWDGALVKLYAMPQRSGD